MTQGADWRPSVQLGRVLSGDVALQDAPASIQSWARLHIYQTARGIIALETKQERRDAMLRVPALIRPMVDAEGRRLWGLRGA